MQTATSPLSTLRTFLATLLNRPSVQHGILALDAIIVNAMQTFQEREQNEALEVVEGMGQSIKQPLHAEVPSLRQEIGELKALLSASLPQASRPVPHPSEQSPS